MTPLPAPRDLAELVRLPAALTVPGDAWTGAAWSRSVGGAGALMPIGSVLLYWSGMALNDWSDREVDAVERPERVIPTGRVSADSALGVAAALGAAGLVATAVVGGRSALRTSVPLAALIAAYDLLAKDSAAGPVVMASTRGLDVLLGATAGGIGAAAAPAVSVAVHTFGVTVLSRGEVHGTHGGTAALALAATATATALLLATAAADGGRTVRLVPVLGCAALYAVAVGRPQLRAVTSPDAGTARAATGAGIAGLTLLQAGWLAARGRVLPAIAVATAGPLLRRAARSVSPT